MLATSKKTENSPGNGGESHGAKNRGIESIKKVEVDVFFLLMEMLGFHCACFGSRCFFEDLFFWGEDE